jgi:glycosyltransferase involved in cell wall biosynthesis
MGMTSEIFALHEHPNLRGESRKAAELSPTGDAAQLLLHYSLGSPLNDLYRNWKRGRRSLIYHNITPPQWFERVNPRVAGDIRTGIEELPALCAETDLILADSRFNGSEIEALGFKAELLELCLDPKRWERPRNDGIFQAVRAQPGIHLLHVGRLAPNKSVEEIIKCFFYLNRFIEPNSHLWLAGIDTDTEVYSFALRRLAVTLGVSERVHFLGCRSDEEIRALFEACTVYVCMSRHEGFCLPLIEAMYFGLPVIALNRGAVPDTVGDGGILVGEYDSRVLAELVHRVATDSQLREKLIIAGRERVSRLTYESFRSRVGELFQAA